MATLDCDGHESTSGPMGQTIVMARADRRKIRAAQTDAGPIEFLDGVIVGGRQRMKLAKTISVGGEPGLETNLRFSVSVQWSGEKWPARTVTLKVGDYVAYIAPWSEQARATATGIIATMLDSTEPDLCKYLTRALMEVEL